ncbi:uncharacterized protein LY89DRAFT_71254 [Mollisia scopiformis]|uniref:Uncharacterized protein n=1 Tax=Mollisia scopiformis TaxID=149040 RepID=A0A194XA83_MOLSC|nr:uncharacterized protein LY89DRAFT_71254 [Mollisia scopiformis]KUJ17076.1 hypothetical protein LY89DRAFT_71254 [Mollisia scopiformis]
MRLLVPACSDPILCTIYSGQVLSFPGRILPSGIEGIGVRLPNNGSLSAALSLTRKDLTRCSLLLQAASKLSDSIRNGNSLNQQSPDPGYCPETKLRALYSSHIPAGIYRETHPLLSISSQNWNSEELETDSDRTWFVSAMMLLPIAYGCVHLGTLNFVFPTSIERLLWKISCIILISCGASIGVYYFMVYATGLLSKLWRRFGFGRNKQIDQDTLTNAHNTIDNPLRFVKRQVYYWLTDDLLGRSQYAIEAMGFFEAMLFCIVCVLYCSARCYVVLESFISLRRVPIGVYQTPAGNFLNYIPHL